MNIWLDDERPMPEGFDTHIKTPWEAIDLLKTGKVESISLDNDLGLFNYAAPNEGRHVAQWIEQAAFEGTLSRFTVMVHTANSVARKEICTAIQNAYRYWAQHESGCQAV